MKKTIIAFALIILLLGCTAGSETQNNTDTNIPTSTNPTNPEPSTNNNSQPQANPNEITIKNAKLSIADITLNANRDQIIEINVLVTPLETGAANGFKIKPFLEQNSQKAVEYTSTARIDFANLNAAEKRILSYFNSDYWQPARAAEGDYLLALEIMNPNTSELLGTIKKPVSMKPTAAKIQ